MNEYVETIERVTGPSEWSPDAYDQLSGNSCVRYDLVKEYSWAIPNDEAIDVLVEESPIIEVGAGNGYWAYLADEDGADVVAFDMDPWEAEWFPVLEGDICEILNYQDRSLFLCWPPYDNPMAADALDLYTGDTVIYVGEGRGGCTGDSDFHFKLQKEFGLADEIIDIPVWEGIHDRMYVFRR